MSILSPLSAIVLTGVAATNTCVPISCQAVHVLDFGSGGTLTVPRAAPREAPIGIGFWYRVRAAVKKPVHLVSTTAPASEGASSVFIGFENATRIRFGVRNADGKLFSVGGKVPRADATWHHVAASFDGTFLAIWLDGRELERREVKDFGELAAADESLIVGPVATAASRSVAVFPGSVTELRVYARGRATAEIQACLGSRDRANTAGLRLDMPLGSPIPSASLRTADDRRVAVPDVLARCGWTISTRPRAKREATSARDLHCIDIPDLENAGRRILVSRKAKGKRSAEQPGVLWQDELGHVRLTWLSFDDAEQTTTLVEGKGVLAAGTTDESGNCYTLRIEPLPRNRDESQAVVAHLHRHAAAPTKKSKKNKSTDKVQIDTTRGAFNLWSYGGRWHGNLRFSKGALGLVLPRTMYRSRDGLRHQSAIAVTFSAKTLQVLRMLGTTSSHSMGNILTTGTKGDFLALDLGDNYPRGVHLHRFTNTAKASQVVFTYKTAHATRARNGSPVYSEISKNGQTFYKWSNDNATYSELGAVLERKGYYEVIFATDRSLDGRVLDNSRAFRGCDDPRNVALLRARKTLGKGRGSVISDSVMVNIPKGSKAEEGGFFDFGGRWSPQRVPAVHWLTQYRAGESARAPQACTRSDGSTLVIWEKSGNDGRSLETLEIDKRGKWTTPRSIAADIRLAREDRMIRVGDGLCFLGQLGYDGRTRLYYFRD